MIIAQSTYSIFIESKPNAVFTEWLSTQSYDQIFILCDEHTEALCYPALANLITEHTIITIPPGESFKSIHTCTAIWEELSSNLATRKSLLINLGGGVIGDMGGFAAATFKRGFDFIQMPTTLLAQVDASVGGKLGIDLQDLKNLIGVFKNPNAVFICTDFLQTLPKRQLRSGFAEVLKHGMIYSKPYWQQVSQIDIDTCTEWPEIIAQSVRIKSAVVERDPLESGLRKILNFGHTIGHAIETISLRMDEDPLLHGEAIAIGMICEAYLSAQVAGLTQEALTEITNVLMRYFEHYDVSKISMEELMEIMAQDKKNEQQQIRFSLLESIGACGYDLLVTEQHIHDALQFYKGL